MRDRVLATAFTVVMLLIASGATAQQQPDAGRVTLSPKAEVEMQKFKQQLESGEIKPWQIWLACQQFDSWIVQHGWNFDALPMNRCMRMTKKPAQILGLPRPSEQQCHAFIREHLLPLLPLLYKRFSHYCW